MLRSAAVFTLLFCAAAANVRAASAEQPPAPDPRVALLKLLPAGSKLEDLRPSPIAGIYEFMQGAEVSYLTADGKYFIDGNLYDMKSRDNLTEALRTHARLALINAVPESRDADLLAAESEVHHHRVYRRRLRVLPETAQPDGGTQSPRDSRSLHVLSAHRTRDGKLEKGRGGLVLSQPQ